MDTLFILSELREGANLLIKRVCLSPNLIANLICLDVHADCAQLFFHSHNTLTVSRPN